VLVSLVVGPVLRKHAGFLFDFQVVGFEEFAVFNEHLKGKAGDSSQLFLG